MSVTSTTAATTVAAGSDVRSQESRPLNAATDGQDRKIVRDRDGDAAANVGEWLRPFGALALVVAIIFALRYALRKLGRPMQHSTGPATALDVIARAAVAPRQQLLLVRLGRRLVLLGSGPGGLSTLSEISQADEVASVLSACGRGDAHQVVKAVAASTAQTPVTQEAKA